MQGEIPAAVLQRARAIRLLALDVDGTLTDGRLWYAEDGRELKVFHVRDGLGIKLVQRHGLAVAIITARVSHALALRARELNIVHLYQGREDKRACLGEIANALGLPLGACAMVGDDLPDIATMHSAGLAIAVADAHPWVAAAAHWQTQRHGGAGAVREVCDLLLRAQDLATAEQARWQ